MYHTMTMAYLYHVTVTPYHSNTITHTIYHTTPYHTIPHLTNTILYMYHTITMAYNVSITYHTTPYQRHVIPMPPYPYHIDIIPHHTILIFIHVTCSMYHNMPISYHTTLYQHHIIPMPLPMPNYELIQPELDCFYSN